MSDKLISIRMSKVRWFIVLAVLVLCSACFALFLKQVELEVATRPVVTDKQRKLAHHEDHVHAMGKSGGIVNIEISAPEKESDVGAGSRIELVAVITARKSFETLEYAWLLPEGVTAAGGDTTGQFQNLERGDTAEVRLSVVKSTNQNRQIHLHVFQMVGNERVGKVAQYNTVFQEKFDAEIRSKAEILRSRMPASDPDGQFKLMQ
ncbi:MAG: hypothetical protein V4692_03850 [Bdellovibrionota bacterium]